MRRFRLNIILYCMGSIGFAILSGCLIGVGHLALGIAALLGSLLLLSMLLVLTRKVVHLTSSFVLALENDDRTMRFDIDSDDREIREMSRSMNRIVQLHHDNQLELETRKLYYDRILRIMTHEMRNSITPVIALANDYGSHPEKYDASMLSEIMAVIGNQAEGIKKFLDSYYNLTHLPQPRLQAIPAEEFCNRIMTLTHLEEKQRGVKDSICSFSVPVDMKMNIDADLLTQAVMNLLRNALDAVSEVENPQIEFSISISNGEPFISISDNGPGISEAMKPNLFQPFFTTKPEGSGIGLSLSRQIARLHGGNITMTSNPRHGTNVILTLGKDSITR